MIKFKTNNLVTGYIKQLLSDFNLPCFKVYTEDTTLVDGALYIKDNKLQKCKINKTSTGTEVIWTICKEPYIYNKLYLNNTTQLKITNNIYDSYTHEYLGEYLRFQRDYNKIDLMPLYNCFSDTICTNLNLDIKLTSESVLGAFKTDEAQYKIYMLPVKLFKKYTIAIDSDAPVEICCALYDNNNLIKNDKYSNFTKYTFTRYNKMIFDSAQVYDKLTTYWDPTSETKEEEKKLLFNGEQNLKMFIKVAYNNQSTVTVLEGDYKNYNDCLLKESKFLLNHTINNHEKDQAENVRTHAFKPITNLQLLKYDTHVSYPIADRLIEYLVDNAITSADKLKDNIIRTQKVIKENNNKNTGIDGIWNFELQRILYDFMNTDQKANKIEFNHDCLGYVDKDVERWYRSSHIKKETGIKETINTLNNIDLYGYDNIISQEER